MRGIALLVLPPLAALACVYALALATDAPKPSASGTAPSFVWKKQEFKNKREFSAWLERRDVRYDDWRARHPGASLPWEDGGIGREVFAFLAAGLAALLAALVRARSAIRGFLEPALALLRERLRSVEMPRGAPPAGRLSLPDAVAVYGVGAPSERLARAELVVAPRQPSPEHARDVVGEEPVAAPPDEPPPPADTPAISEPEPSELSAASEETAVERLFWAVFAAGFGLFTIGFGLIMFANDAPEPMGASVALAVGGLLVMQVGWVGNAIRSYRRHRRHHVSSSTAA
jgi:hypothetical protein